MNLVDDAYFMIRNGPEPAELALYRPWQAKEREIWILVNRHPLESAGSGQQTGPSFPRYLRKALEIFSVMDDVRGIWCPNVEKDEIEFKEHITDTKASVFSLASIISEISGLYRLQVVR